MRAIGNLISLIISCLVVASCSTRPGPAAGALAATVSCRMPPATQSWRPFREERLSESSTSYYPTWPRVIEPGSDPRDLAGEYELRMISTNATSTDSIAIGTLELVATTPEHSDIAQQLRAIPLIGWATIELDPLGYLPVAHPLDQRDPGRPGVQSSFEFESGRLAFVVGNSLEFRSGELRSRTTHVGVRLYVFEATDAFIVGRWTGGGRAEPGAEGYFCAARVSALIS